MTDFVRIRQIKEGLIAARLKRGDKVLIVEGAGIELEKLIAKIGLNPATNCKCGHHVKEMNMKGSDWCEQNIDTIVGWLYEEAQRAKLPFTKTGAKILVKRAIHNARKKEKNRQKD